MKSPPLNALNGGFLTHPGFDCSQDGHKSGRIAQAREMFLRSFFQSSVTSRPPGSSRIQEGSMQRRYDTIVIGGGLAGLTAALHLQRSGRSTAIVEKSSNCGGRARTKEVSRFLFNQGPRAVFNTGAGAIILKKLGIPLAGGRVAGGNRKIVHEGTIHEFPTTLGGIISHGLFSKRGKLELVRFMTALHVQMPDAKGVTMGEYFDGRFTDPLARGFADFLCRLCTYAGALDRLDAKLGLEQMRLTLRGGVTYLDGGWQAIADSLFTACAEAGCVFHTGDGAREVQRDRGQVEVNLTNNTLFSDSAILAVGPEVQASLLGAAIPEYTPVRAACLDLGFSELPSPQITLVAALSRPYYYSVHTVYARLAPGGRHVAHAAKYLAPNEPSGDHVRAELEGFLDEFQKGWREQVVAKRFLPDMIVAHRLQTQACAPGIRIEEGLYRAGDWTEGSGMLLDRALSSAVLAANEVLSLQASNRSSSVVS